MKKVYSMDSYFNGLTYMIAFYDVLIKKNNLTKDGLFEELNISYTSYKRAKEIQSSSTKLIVNKLNRYFGVNELDYSKQEEYEDTLNSLLSTFFYHGDNIQGFEPTIQKYIDENNYLKPLFLLLLLLIKSAALRSPQAIFKENEELYNEVKKYKDTFYVSPFMEIYTIIDVCYCKTEYKGFNKDIVINDNLRGLVYNAYCSNAYLTQRYDLCLYYARECKDQLVKACNYNRLSIVNLTYFACLNKIGEYSKCIVESRNQLLYLVHTSASERMINSTRIHYYTACIGLQDYEEVITNITSKDKLSTSDYIFLLVAGSHNKKEYTKYIEMFHLDSSNRSEKEIDDINTIIGYLSKKQRAYYKDKLAKIPLNIGLKDILFKYY